jgi:Polyketide cyclase / dehydrase and lipid transport.
VQQLRVQTQVAAPIETVYETLLEFTRYARYAEHLERVEVLSEPPQAAYRMHFAWWVLRYDLDSTVTETDAPTRIGWMITRGLDAEGAWSLAAVDAATTAVEFDAVYDPHSADVGGLSLPAFVSTGWLIEKIKPALVEEAEGIVAAMVADIEGQPRPVDLTVETDTIDA